MHAIAIRNENQQMIFVFHFVYEIDKAVAVDCPQYVVWFIKIHAIAKLIFFYFFWKTVNWQQIVYDDMLYYSIVIV